MKKIIFVLALLAFIPLASAALNTAELGNVLVEETKYDPYPAEPGKYITVWISVDNQGSTTMDNMFFKFDPDYPFQLNPGQSGIVSTGKLPPGQDKLVEYTLRVDEEAMEGSYELDLKLCYGSDCSSWARTYSLQISVRTGGEPKVELGLEETDVFNAGKLGEFTLNIVNRGQLDTKFLRVAVQESDNYEIIGPAEKYIGELESDDFETAQYQIFIENNIGSEESEMLEVPIKVEYSDENNKDYSDFQTIYLKSYSTEDLEKMHLAASSLTWIWVPIVIIIGISYFIYIRVKKKKQQKKA